MAKEEQAIFRVQNTLSGVIFEIDAIGSMMEIIRMAFRGDEAPTPEDILRLMGGAEIWVNRLKDDLISIDHDITEINREQKGEKA